MWTLPSYCDKLVKMFLIAQHLSLSMLLVEGLIEIGWLYGYLLKLISKLASSPRVWFGDSLNNSNMITRLSGEPLWSKAPRKNDLGFLVVMVNNPKTMTKINSHHFLKFLVPGHSVKWTPGEGTYIENWYTHALTCSPIFLTCLPMITSFSVTCVKRSGIATHFSTNERFRTRWSWSPVTILNILFSVTNSICLTQY